jgi:hypothetical protein
VTVALSGIQVPGSAYLYQSFQNIGGSLNIQGFIFHTVEVYCHHRNGLVARQRRYYNSESVGQLQKGDILKGKKTKREYDHHCKQAELLFHLTIL